MDAWVDGWMDGCVGGWVDMQMSKKHESFFKSLKGNILRGKTLFFPDLQNTIVVGSLGKQT